MKVCRPWKLSEVEQVRNRYARESAVIIARDLNRTAWAIRNQAFRMGIKKDFVEFYATYDNWGTKSATPITPDSGE